MNETGQRPVAIVTRSINGGGAALGVLRSLGRAGVTTHLLTDDPSDVAAHSRYCRARHQAPGFTTAPDAVLEQLSRIAATLRPKPVLFPTSDPDLVFVSTHRARLERDYVVVAPPPDLVATLCDKRRFAAFAQTHGFPVPETHVFDSEEALAAQAERLPYPVIVKPGSPYGWGDEALARGVAGKKALILDSAAALQETFRRLLPVCENLIVQELVPGDDPEHYELHLYLDAAGRTLACFTGQKARLTPPHAGSGCFVRSVWLPELAQQTAELLVSVGYRGLANIDFKRDPQSGAYRMLEINPRVSTWNVFSSACGADLAYAAYADAVGYPVPDRVTQREGACYVDFERDLFSFFESRRAGEMRWSEYLRTLAVRDLVFQHWAPDDPGPFVVSLGRLQVRALGKLRRMASSALG
jgi:D-aspartate ligase